MARKTINVAKLVDKLVADAKGDMAGIICHLAYHMEEMAMDEDNMAVEVLDADTLNDLADIMQERAMSLKRLETKRNAKASQRKAHSAKMNYKMGGIDL